MATRKTKPVEKKHPSVKGTGPGRTVTDAEALARNTAIDNTKAVLAGLGCREAAPFGRGEYVPCGQPAIAIVGWKGRREQPVPMCAACANHNVKNRGGVLLSEGDPLFADALARAKKMAAAMAAPLPPTAYAETRHPATSRLLQAADSRVVLVISEARVISKVALQKTKDLQVLKGELESQLADVKARLLELEPGIIDALEAKIPLEPGAPYAEVHTSERIVPKWKDEAVALAVQAGRNAKQYEAEVKSRTEPTITKKLVINGVTK